MLEQYYNIYNVKVGLRRLSPPAVQAGNLIVFVRSELSSVTAGAVIGVAEAH
jgi:hypothetical protein